MNIERQLDLIGTPGVIAIGVIFCCIAFVFSAVIPVFQDRNTQRAELHSLKTRPASVSTPSSEANNKTENLYALFPNIDQLPNELEALHKLAEKERLELGKGEYKLQSEGKKLYAYTFNLPVSGNYQQIRNFIDRALSERAALALESIKLDKKKISDTQMQAQLNFTIHFQKTKTPRETEVITSARK